MARYWREQNVNRDPIPMFKSSTAVITSPVLMGPVGYVGENTDLQQLGITLRNMHRGWHSDSTFAPGPGGSRSSGVFDDLFGRRTEEEKYADKADHYLNKLWRLWQRRGRVDEDIANTVTWARAYGATDEEILALAPGVDLGEPGHYVLTTGVFDDLFGYDYATADPAPGPRYQIAGMLVVGASGLVPIGRVR